MSGGEIVVKMVEVAKVALCMVTCTQVTITDYNIWDICSVFLFTKQMNGAYTLSVKPVFYLWPVAET